MCIGGLCRVGVVHDFFRCFRVPARCSGARARRHLAVDPGGRAGRPRRSTSHIDTAHAIDPSLRVSTASCGIGLTGTATCARPPEAKNAFEDASARSTTSTSALIALAEAAGGRRRDVAGARGAAAEASVRVDRRLELHRRQPVGGWLDETTVVPAANRDRVGGCPRSSSSELRRRARRPRHRHRGLESARAGAATARGTRSPEIARRTAKKPGP